MNKKSVPVLLLSVLSCFSMAKAASAYPGLHGNIGRNLEVWVDFTAMMENLAVNSTIDAVISVSNYAEIYVKNLQIEFDLYFGTQTQNITLAQNQNLPLTWAGGGGFLKEVYFTPNRTGPLRICVSGDYTYIQGDQTIEETGFIETDDMLYIPSPSYNDMKIQIWSFQDQIIALNDSYQKLNASYQDQQTMIHVLEVITGFLIVTTVAATIMCLRLRKKQQ